MRSRSIGSAPRGRRDSPDALIQMQRASQITGTAAVEEKAVLRESLGLHVASLIGIAKTAARTDAAVTVHLRIPRGRTSERAFIALARVAVAEATAKKEAFLNLGMPEDLLDGAVNRQLADDEPCGTLKTWGFPACHSGRNEESLQFGAEPQGIPGAMRSLGMTAFPSHSSLLTPPGSLPRPPDHFGPVGHHPICPVMPESERRGRVVYSPYVDGALP